MDKNQYKELKERLLSTKKNGYDQIGRASCRERVFVHV